jgi:CRISPR-associated endonuclease Cas2
MSITEKILNLLNTKTSNYKGIPVNCFGLPIFKEYNKQSVKNSFSKLYSKNFIKYDGSYIKITKEGEKYIKRRSTFLQSFRSNLNENKEKNLLVLFDIQEERKAEREWFRRHLRKFGYIMIQRSVWVGPSPLPKEFVGYVKKIKLQESIKTFKLATGYTNKKIGL